VSLEMFLVSGSVETLGYGGVIFLLGAWTSKFENVI
jgi:hypothetical protein